MTQARVSSVRYVMEPRLSQFTVHAFASGLMSGVAHSPKIAIRDWTGETAFVPDSLKEAFLRLKAQMASLEVTDDMPESDRRQLHRVMHQEVLETTVFPEFTFESTAIDSQREKQDVYRLNVTGGLTLHGIRNPVSFAAQVAFGVDSYRAHGSFTIFQSDYGLKIASIASASLKLRDELKCSFYIVAKKTLV